MNLEELRDELEMLVESIFATKIYPKVELVLNQAE